MFSLIRLLVGVCLVGVTYAKTEAEIREYFMGLGIKCNTENPIEPKYLIMLREHKIPDDEKTMCLLACIYRKAEWMNDKGEFDVAKAIALTEKNVSDPDKVEKSKQLMELCKKVNDESVTDGKKGCIRAAMLSKCLIENSPKMGIEIPAGAGSV